MERDHGQSAEGAASFHTRWTIVMRAAQSQAQGGQSALAELCRLYWYPLYIFARRRGYSPDEPVEFLTPEKMFDARWAMTVLGEALKQLRQEYAIQGKTATLEALKAFLDANNSVASPSYDEVANRLQVTTGGSKNLSIGCESGTLHRCERRSVTVSDPAEVDEEIHALCEALVASGG